MERKLTAVILQARLDSSRLPGKAMLPLDGKPLIYRVMKALNAVKADLRVLACTEDSISTFEPIANEANFEVFAGPKEDVLLRFCQVIRKHSIDRVIRATGDNPFVFSDAANSLESEAVSIDADYAGYVNLPYGAGVESVKASALLRAAEETSESFNREHVCPYLYNNPDKFKIHRPPAPQMWHYPDIRLTVDTQEDYERAKKLYSILNNKKNTNNGSIIIDMYNSICLSSFASSRLGEIK
ncbi:MAG: spore coat protein [Treponema sp.]|nr:spore coat protein [Treponema sp.]